MNPQLSRGFMKPQEVFDAFVKKNEVQVNGKTVTYTDTTDVVAIAVILQKYGTNQKFASSLLKLCEIPEKVNLDNVDSNVLAVIANMVRGKNPTMANVFYDASNSTRVDFPEQFQKLEEICEEKQEVKRAFTTAVMQCKTAAKTGSFKVQKSDQYQKYKFEVPDEETADLLNKELAHLNLEFGVSKKDNSYKKYKLFVNEVKNDGLRIKYSIFC